MKEWYLTKIGSLCKRVCSGGTPKSSVEEYYGGGIPWLNTKEVNFNRIYSTVSTISEAGLNNSSAKWIDKHSVIIAMYGATAAKCAIGMIPMTTNQACCNLMIDEDLADYRYVYYALTNAYSKLASLANGGAQQNLNAQLIKDFKIPLPNLQTQHRIADILSTFDDKIENNVRINHNLEEQAKALYKSWFVDFEPFKDGQFVDSELGMIPEGWRVGTLSELGDIVAGGTPSKTKPEYYTNNGIAWLTPKDLSVKCYKFTARGEIDITEDGYKNSSAKLMPRGSVLFSSRAPIGYISIAKGDICTNQGFKSVVPKYAGTAYLYYWLCENTEAIEAQASGSTFKEASGSLMRSFPALVPEKSVIDSFEKELSPILNEQEILEEEINYAEQIRDSLLPRLMSGELVMNC